MMDTIEFLMTKGPFLWRMIIKIFWTIAFIIFVADEVGWGRALIRFRKKIKKSRHPKGGSDVRKTIKSFDNMSEAHLAVRVSLLHDKIKKMISRTEGKLQNLEREGDCFSDLYKITLKLKNSYYELLSMPLETEDDADQVEWLFNNGKLRSEEELKEFEEACKILEETKKQKQISADYIESGDFDNDSEILDIEDNYVNIKRLCMIFLLPPILPSIVLYKDDLELLLDTIQSGFKGRPILDVLLLSKRILTGILFDTEPVNNSLMFCFTVITFLIFYFVIGGFDLIDSIGSEVKWHKIHKKAGLKTSIDKNLLLKAGLYGFNLFNLFRKK